MDKNTITGFLLIFMVIIVWQQFMAPSPGDLEREQRRIDSLKQIELIIADSLENQGTTENHTIDPSNVNLPDSQKIQQISGQFGPFAAAAIGEESSFVLQNDLMKIIFNSKGGRITEVELKDYLKLEYADTTKEEIKSILKLLEDSKNKFEYHLPVPTVQGGIVNTGKLFFDARKEGNTISFKAFAGNGQYFEQKYTIKEGSYDLDYELNFVGLENILARDVNSLKLNWVENLDKVEFNDSYERNYSTIYFKDVNEDADYCSCMSDETVEMNDKKVKWVAHSNQFFESILIARTENFNGGSFTTEAKEETDDDLKKLKSEIQIPYSGDGTYAMSFFIGPKQFDLLKSYELNLEDTVPFGYSLFGTVNRWIVRPLFNFLSSYFVNFGIIIFILTLMVRVVLYPLSYKMLYSQSKMAALKPRMASLKEKYKDDAQKLQMENMKIYREYGVNPMGGCLPMLFQMPIWIALYRFFPASIEFRQKSFLWANDLSSYDIFTWLPWDIPFYGEHLSLFTILWAGTTVLYTYYNMKHMDMAAMSNPMMKYMQYFMPVMFLFFFNNFASGLTCYLFFSNILNITQTLVTKNFLIDKDKILRELDNYKKKPKKKGGFQARLASALEEQQKVQAEREKRGRKGKKKK